ncbi:10377_t:CDS:2, partial [Ambispora gerdemannii]
MSTLKCKGSFEFTIFEATKLVGDVYSPPFATSNEMFWQLVFNPSTPDHPQFCSLGLRAIPNPEEENTTGIWKNRDMYFATIFLKDPKTQKKIDIGRAELNGFSATRRGFGWKDFCHNSELPAHGELVFGVEFENADIGLVAHSVTLPGRSLPKDLVDAWGDQLNNPDTADAQFNVNGRTIYANSGILCRRSDYFNTMFNGAWSETKAKKTPNRQMFTRHVRDMSEFSLGNVSIEKTTGSVAA